jgi:soluble P-type ATPase
MIKVDIPGFGHVDIKHLVSDFTGTLSEDGHLCEGVQERLNKLSKDIQIHILTADTFGVAKKELEGIDCKMVILEGPDHDVQKEEYVRSLGSNKIIALGNGKNDRRMLKEARVGVAICLKEGCSVDAIKNADILVKSAVDALDLLLNPKRMKATLRF